MINEIPPQIDKSIVATGGSNITNATNINNKKSTKISISLILKYFVPGFITGFLTSLLASYVYDMLSK